MEGEQKQADLIIEINPADTELLNGIKEFLKEQQNKGNLKFEMNTRRICDFCKKILNDGDNFISLPDGNDKCKECQDKK
jgi:hypothetical protein